jgi:fused signal recognition particle receptor
MQPEDAPPETAAEAPPAAEVEADAPPAADVEADAPPAADVEAEAPPAADVEAEAPPAADVEADAPPAADVEAEAPPAADVEADAPPAADVEADAPPAADVEAEAAPEAPPATTEQPQPMVPAEEMPGPDAATFIGLLVAVLVGIFFVVALRRQRRRRREEMSHADEAAHPETEEPHIPEEALPPPMAGREVTPVPPVEEGPPASPEAAPAAQEAERRHREEEKQRKREAFLAQQRAAREAKDQEAAERLAAEEAAEAERRREAEADEQRAAEEAARREALLDSSGPLTERLAKTRTGFVGRLNALLGKTIDEDTLEELEEILFTADIGVQTAGDLLGTVRESLKKKDLADPARIREALKTKIAETLHRNGHVPGREAIDPDSKDVSPYVIMVVGVNGVGKTTTIGKLAGRYVALGKKVILAAGDTFRAAAVEQLEVWGDRVGCEVVRGPEGGDPGSVTFDAVKKGVNEGADVVIVDTAGRLHTKAPLMEELQKVHRVLGKAREGAPDEVLLVVDATTGQNALQQARLFKEAVALTGIALTKLDGTAKGGVVIGIAGELGLPVRYIGVGEKVGDLQPFDPEGFVDALFG